MEFKDFDENVYFTMLENFKKTHTENIIDQLGSIENYNALLSELKAQGEQLVEKAVQEYGSLEKYAEAMKEHTQAFLENGPSVSQEEAKELADQTDALTRQLKMCIRDSLRADRRTHAGIPGVRAGFFRPFPYPAHSRPPHPGGKNLLSGKHKRSVRPVPVKGQPVPHLSAAHPRAGRHMRRTQLFSLPPSHQTCGNRCV